MWLPARDALTFGVSRLRFLERFTGVLAALTRHRLPLGEGLRLASREPGWAGRAEVVERVARELEGGAPLAAALARRPDVFDPGYRAIVAASERASTLPEGVGHLATYLRAQTGLAGALLAAALAVHQASARYTFAAARVAADRLAEAGLEHAFARLALDPGFRGRFEGRLLEGRYEVLVAAAGDGVRLTSSGTVATGRSVRVDLELRSRDGRLVAAERRRAHLVAGR